MEGRDGAVGADCPTGCMRGGGEARGCALVSAAARLPCPARFWTDLDHLSIGHDRLPVEGDRWIAGFYLAQHLRFERLAADADTTGGGGAEDVEDTRALAGAFAVPVDEIRSFVPALVADHAQERHTLLTLLRPR